MSTSNQALPDQDAIARNLIYLDIGHITLEEATPYEYELSVIASLNEAIETINSVLRTPDPPDFWRDLYPTLSDAAALLSSRIAPLIDTNAEREAENQRETAPTTQPLEIAHL